MTANDQIPEGLRKVAREAAVQRLSQPALNGGQHWDSDVEGAPEWIAIMAANAVLAALLDGGKVREEWGCRLTIPDGEIPDCWRDSREAAEAMVSWHINNRSIATPALIRRLHLTLAAEVMGTEERR